MPMQVNGGGGDQEEIFEDEGRERRGQAANKGPPAPGWSWSTLLTVPLLLLPLVVLILIFSQEQGGSGAALRRMSGGRAGGVVVGARGQRNPRSRPGHD